MCRVHGVTNSRTYALDNSKSSELPRPGPVMKLQPVLSDLLDVRVGSQRESRAQHMSRQGLEAESFRVGSWKDKKLGELEKSLTSLLGHGGWTCRECRATGQLGWEPPCHHIGMDCRPVPSAESWMWEGGGM